MRISSENWHFMAVVFLSAATSIFGLWTFVTSLEPVPNRFSRVSGVVETVEIQRTRGSANAPQFTLQNSSTSFVYHTYFPGAGALSSFIRPGMTAEVAYTGNGKPELWSLTLDNREIIDIPRAYRARRTEGYWGLALAIGCGFAGVFLWRTAIELEAT